MSDDNGNVSLPGMSQGVPRWFLFLAVGAVVAILFMRRGDSTQEGDNTDELLVSEFNRRLQEQWELFQSWLQQAYPSLPSPAPDPVPSPKPKTPPDICQGDPYCEKGPPPTPVIVPSPIPVLPVPNTPPIEKNPPGIEPPPNPYAKILPYDVPTSLPNIVVQGGGAIDDLRGGGLTESINLGNRQVEYAGVKLPYVVAREVDKLVVQ